MEIKWHSPDLNALAKYGSGSNSGRDWTAQITVGNKLLGQDLQFYRRASNDKLVAPTRVLNCV